MNFKKACLIIIACLFIALFPSMPYGYYSMMRWVVCASCVYLALTSHKKAKEGWAWGWGVFAGIYNPIFPIHSDREIWFIVNIATIIVAIWYMVQFHALDNKKTQA